MKNEEQASSKTTNIYKRARLLAAEHNDSLKTLASAADEVNIRRQKLGEIEQEDSGKNQTVPNFDDIVRMIHVYGAPELRSYFCTHHCPLGEGLPVLEYENLDRISLRLLVALRRIEQVRDELGDILVDGTVAEAERVKFRKIVETLKSIASQANSLELWAQKNGLL